MIEAMDKVHGAVDRVDDKKMPGVQLVPPVVLLAEKTGAGQSFLQPPHQQGLHLPVIFRHHIPVAGLVLGQDAPGVEQQRRRLPLGGRYSFKDIPWIHNFCHIYQLLNKSIIAPAAAPVDKETPAMQILMAGV